MKNFENRQLSEWEFPTIDDIYFHPLEKNYKYGRWISNGIFIFALLVAALVIGILNTFWEINWLFPAIIIGSLILLSITSVLIHIGFSIKGYTIRQHDIIYRTGLIIRSITTIPFNRIQHVEIEKNVIDDLLGLSKISVYTAGGRSSDIRIPGLKPEKAQQIKDLILRKIHAESEEEE
jgi:membrane protein YdbS with pleckstrin-like domain